MLEAVPDHRLGSRNARSTAAALARRNPPGPASGNKNG